MYCSPSEIIAGICFVPLFTGELANFRVEVYIIIDIWICLQRSIPSRLCLSIKFYLLKKLHGLFLGCTTMEKQIIRKQFLSQRKQLDSVSYLRLSHLAQKRLIEGEIFTAAKSVALYNPVNYEVATEQLDALARAQGKQVCYPRVVGRELEFIITASIDQFVAGSFGVPEPTGEKKVDALSVDLLVVPGVAFDLNGYRIGYGGGYYDRLLAGHRKKTLIVGLFFEAQWCEQLPVEDHDQPLDLIVTEARNISCHI